MHLNTMIRRRNNNHFLFSRIIYLSYSGINSALCKAITFVLTAKFMSTIIRRQNRSGSVTPEMLVQPPKIPSGRCTSLPLLIDFTSIVNFVSHQLITYSRNSLNFLGRLSGKSLGNERICSWFVLTPCNPGGVRVEYEAQRHVDLASPQQACFEPATYG
ncbi:hypothetical protein DL98DRAFT_90660 [Cadophora sp. DSE1049]|nr:hypothetical protein DL98DRAFT_90660 [Cadophora sp. DSE1049]